MYRRRGANDEPRFHSGPGVQSEHRFDDGMQLRWQLQRAAAAAEYEIAILIVSQGSLKRGLELRGCATQLDQALCGLCGHHRQPVIACEILN